MNFAQKLKLEGIPTCNINSILSSVKSEKRIDGRSLHDFRPVFIGFGLDFGSSIVSLGATRVVCNISCIIAEPKLTKSCEGSLNLKLSNTVAYSHEKSVEILKILEKNIKESRCLDLESLCIITGEKSFSLLADLAVLNDDGNLPECCSIALLASLSHFKRPNVTITEDTIKISSLTDCNPIPLNILHYPFCTSFSFLDHSKFVCDPMQAEEQVFVGSLIIGANIYREVTTVHVSGKSSITKDFVIKCCQLAIDRCVYLTNFVKTTVEADLLKRATEGASIGFVPFIKENSSALCCFKKEMVSIDPVYISQEEEDEDIIPLGCVKNTKMFRYAPDTIGMSRTTEKTWNFINDFNVPNGNDEPEILFEINHSTGNLVS